MKKFLGSPHALFGEQRRTQYGKHWDRGKTGKTKPARECFSSLNIG